MVNGIPPWTSKFEEGENEMDPRGPQPMNVEELWEVITCKPKVGFEPGGNR
jgi:hypothetical protein